MGKQPFNNLGQIISGGGDIRVALAIHAGWSQDRISGLIGNTLRPDSPESEAAIMSAADRLLAGGRAYDTTPHDQPLSSADVPLKNLLFGQNSDGLRAMWIGEFQSPSNGNWYQIRLNFPDMPTPDEILAAAEQEALQRMNDSPGRFGGAGQEMMGPINVRSIVTVRSF